MKEFNIGLLVDKYELEGLENEILFHIIKNHNIKKIIFIKQILPKKNFFFYLKKNSFFRNFEKLLLRFIIFFEEKFLSKFFYQYEFEKANLSKIFQKKIKIKPKISKSGFVYKYSQKQVNKIKSQNLDIILRFGSGILKGKILNCAKYGILSFHHGDNNFFRGGPPGFWEVFEKKSETGFVIQKLNEHLDGGDVLFRGYVATKLFYFLNKVSIYKNSARYLSLVLSRILDKNIVKTENKIYYNRLYKDPNFFEIIKYIFNTYSNILVVIIKKFILYKNIRWFVAFKKSTELNKFRIDQFNSINIRDKDIFIADPFLFSKKNKDYLFVEKFSFKENKGVISCFLLTKNKYHFLGDAITEDFHLSFPYIFKYNNKIYMCPETHQKRDIRIYECTKFPLKWKLSKIIMNDISAVDTVIFKKNGFWWLVTCVSNCNNRDFNELNIFYSDNGPLSDSWKSHKLNPIFVDSRTARNAGIIYKNKKIFRVSQKNAFNFYGKKIFLNEILTLNKNEYVEKFHSSVKANFLMNIKGIHHMHLNKNYIAFDYCI